MQSLISSVSVPAELAVLVSLMFEHFPHRGTNSALMTDSKTLLSAARNLRTIKGGFLHYDKKLISFITASGARQWRVRGVSPF